MSEGTSLKELKKDIREPFKKLGKEIATKGGGWFDSYFWKLDQAVRYNNTIKFSDYIRRMAHALEYKDKGLFEALEKIGEYNSPELLRSAIHSLLEGYYTYSKKVEE